MGPVVQVNACWSLERKRFPGAAGSQSYQGDGLAVSQHTQKNEKHTQRKKRRDEEPYIMVGKERIKSRGDRKSKNKNKNRGEFSLLLSIRCQSLPLVCVFQLLYCLSSTDPRFVRLGTLLLTLSASHHQHQGDHSTLSAGSALCVRTGHFIQSLSTLLLCYANWLFQSLSSHF